MLAAVFAPGGAMARTVASKGGAVAVAKQLYDMAKRAMKATKRKTSMKSMKAMKARQNNRIDHVTDRKC